MVNIKENKLQSLNILALKEFNSKNVIGRFAADVTLFPLNENSIFVLVDSLFEIEPILDDFSLRITISIPYEVSPKKDITLKDLFECILMSKEKISRILNEVYSSQKNIPGPEEVEYSDFAEMLEEIIKTIK